MGWRDAKFEDVEAGKELLIRGRNVDSEEWSIHPNKRLSLDRGSWIIDLGSIGRRYENCQVYETTLPDDERAEVVWENATPDMIGKEVLAVLGFHGGSNWTGPHTGMLQCNSFGKWSLPGQGWHSECFIARTKQSQAKDETAASKAATDDGWRMAEWSNDHGRYCRAKGEDCAPKDIIVGYDFMDLQFPWIVHRVCPVREGERKIDKMGANNCMVNDSLPRFVMPATERKL